MMKMLLIRTAAHLGAESQHSIQSPAYGGALNVLACFPSLLAEAANISNIRNKRGALTLGLSVALPGSQRLPRDCYFACDPVPPHHPGSSHHHSPCLGSCLPSLGAEARAERWGEREGLRSEICSYLRTGAKEGTSSLPITPCITGIEDEERRGR